MDDNPAIGAALKSLTNGDSFDALAAPFSELLAAFDLHGYRFCLASVEATGFRVMFVRAGQDLSRAGVAEPGAMVHDEWPILTECYRRGEHLSWTPFLANARAAPHDVTRAVRTLIQENVTAGVSVPLFRKSRHFRASICVSGRKGEDPAAFETRSASFRPFIRLAGLALFEAVVGRERNLTHRAITLSERAVLDGLARGLRVREIAVELGKSERTIRNQIESARLRLDANTTIEAIAKWIKHCSLLP